MRTGLIAMDPACNVACPVHVGISRNVLYFSKTYLDRLKPEDDEDMRELACWLYYGELLIETKMLEGDEQTRAVRTSALTSDFLSRGVADFILPRKELAKRLGDRIRDDILLTYD